MPRSNFDDTLHLPAPSTETPAQGPAGEEEELPGPLAGGPSPQGTLTWIYVWIIQNGPDGRAAAAYGESEHDQTFVGRWDIPTEMAHDSDEFTPGRPALATAMAMVDEGSEGREVYWWSEAVTIAGPQPSSPT
jgi:hypothetical protein